MSWPTEDVESDASLGLALCRLAMGLDELYRRTRSGVENHEAALAAEGLVPVDLWRGAPLHLADWVAAAESTAALQSHTAQVVDPIRRAFLEDTLLSLSTLIGWQAGTDGLSFRERASRLLGLSVESIPSETLAKRRADVLRAVGAPVLEWERAGVVSTEQMPGVFASYAAEARERTHRQVGAVPERPLMRLELVHDVPYTGYCDYFSNTMRLNADQPFTAQRLKLLVLHEAYPGHDYHLWRRELGVRDGRQPLDSLLVVTNTPSSPLFEGIGDNGALLLDWLEPDERLSFELGTLRSAACVNACLMLYEAGEPAERVREFLIEEGCAHPSWASTRLRFMQDPLRAPFVFSYYLGYRSVAEASHAWQGGRTEFYECLYGRMHSPRSLRLAAELSDAKGRNV
ncbi:MAG TPA: hypothetical protein VGJ60_21345 [Chloroflexota bacterium]